MERLRSDKGEGQARVTIDELFKDKQYLRQIEGVIDAAPIGRGTQEWRAIVRSTLILQMLEIVSGNDERHKGRSVEEWRRYVFGIVRGRPLMSSVLREYYGTKPSDHQRGPSAPTAPEVRQQKLTKYQWSLKATEVPHEEWTVDAIEQRERTALVTSAMEVHMNALEVTRASHLKEHWAAYLVDRRGLDHDTAAERLEIARNSFRSYLCRGRKEWRRWLSERGLSFDGDIPTPAGELYDRAA